MEDISTTVARVFFHIQRQARSNTRTLIAIGGPPASGKSTLAEHLQRRLNRESMPCGLVPMDGFHLDNDTLRARGLLSRKGAPETFDVKGFRTLIDRLSLEETISVPLFDRACDCVIADAAHIEVQHRHVIIEGNYLFLNQGLWREFHRHWSLSVFIAPPLDILQQRLIKRWLDHGLPEEAAKERAASNDIPNAKLILTHSHRQTIDILCD